MNPASKILFLTQIVPFPPNAGPRIKTWHVLRHLAGQGHSITLVTFVREEEKQHLPALEQICQSVVAVPIRRSRIQDGISFLQSQVNGLPFLVERDHKPAMKAAIRELVQRSTFDWIHVDQLTLEQFILDIYPALKPNTRTIFDAHNATWLLLERMYQNTQGVLKPILKQETQKIKSYEARLVDRFDYTLAVTEVDRAALQTILPDPKIAEKIHVIPIAVDTDELVAIKRDNHSLEILTLGTLHYPPNADGIRWFIKEVFPQVKQSIPSATLTVIGKNPPADFFNLASAYADSIRITGYVDDLIPYIEKAAVMVVPVLAGGGMRVRILEAFARGMPTVTTTIGLEGIDAQPGTHILVEDDPSGFARAVTRLLGEPSLRDHLSIHGRQLATQRYDWKAVLSRLDSIYQDAQ